MLYILDILENTKDYISNISELVSPNCFSPDFESHFIATLPGW